MRTTLNIDTPILTAVKELQQKERKSLGQLVSELLCEALARRPAEEAAAELRWIAKPMRARVELDDKDAVYAALEREGEP